LGPSLATGLVCNSFWVEPDSGRGCQTGRRSRSGPCFSLRRCPWRRQRSPPPSPDPIVNPGVYLAPAPLPASGVVGTSFTTRVCVPAEFRLTLLFNGLLSPSALQPASPIAPRARHCIRTVHLLPGACRRAALPHHRVFNRRRVFRGGRRLAGLHRSPRRPKTRTAGAVPSRRSGGNKSSNVRLLQPTSICDSGLGRRSAGVRPICGAHVSGTANSCSALIGSRSRHRPSSQTIIGSRRCATIAPFFAARGGSFHRARPRFTRDLRALRAKA